MIACPAQVGAGACVAPQLCRAFAGCKSPFHPSLSQSRRPRWWRRHTCQNRRTGWFRRRLCPCRSSLKDGKADVGVGTGVLCHCEILNLIVSGPGYSFTGVQLHPSLVVVGTFDGPRVEDTAGILHVVVCASNVISLRGDGLIVLEGDGKGTFYIGIVAWMVFGTG